MQRLKWRQRVWIAAQSIFVAAMLFFFVRTVVLRWREVVAFEWHFRVLPLLLSFFLQIIASLFWASVWRYMVVRSGRPLGWAAGVRVYVLSNLAKYIPGSIWGYVSRAHLGRDQGVLISEVGLTVIWEVGLTVVASLILTLIMLPLPLRELSRGYSKLILVVAVVCALALSPPVYKLWARWLQHWGVWKDYAQLYWSDFFLFLGAAFLTHIIVGTAFFAFAAALTDVTWTQWASFVGSWSFSATAGLLFILAPYGIGVKEGLLVLLLSSSLSVEMAMMLSLASRLWSVAGELILVIGVLVAFKQPNISK